VKNKIMKNKWLLAWVLALALCIQPARAISILSGSSDLTSATVLGNKIIIDWDVDLTGLIYTYSYEIINPLGNPVPTTDVHAFSVSFDTTPVGMVLLAPGAIVFPTSVFWAPLSVTPGSSTTVFFTSLYGPTMGNANAQDAVPPSPWASTHLGGEEVPVPHVPDGGITLALLGFALVGIESLRRRLTA
jgi:hypothetical protein